MATRKKLSRADLEKVVGGMSAGDIFRAQAVPDEEKSMAIFNRAADRLGFGEDALDRVPVGDTAYLGELLSDALNLGSKAAGDSSQSPDSSGTGESVQS